MRVEKSYILIFIFAQSVARISSLKKTSFDEALEKEKDSVTTLTSLPYCGISSIVGGSRKTSPL